MKKYADELQKTRTHIVVHAIHAVILKKLFGERRLNREKDAIRIPEYQKSWVIVERDGHDKIISKLTLGLK